MQDGLVYIVLFKILQGYNVSTLIKFSIKKCSKTFNKSLVWHLNEIKINLY
jgi:hypothetical protein